MISSQTHTAHLLATAHDVALYEITQEHAEVQPLHRFYVVAYYGEGQVISIVPADRPSGGGYWTGRISAAGIAYVAGARTRATARRWYRTFVRAHEAEAQEQAEATAYWATHPEEWTRHCEQMDERLAMA